MQNTLDMRRGEIATLFEKAHDNQLDGLSGPLYLSDCVQEALLEGINNKVGFVYLHNDAC